MLRAAAIDVGSSATRLSRLTLSHAGVVVQTELQRFDMRLGADVFGSGRISEARQIAFVKLFETLANTLRRAGITHYRAVATSAMRDAQNGAEVCQAVAEASGLTLEIISGQQEGALSRRALVRALGSVDADALMVDLGGGSLEIERLDGSISQSVPMGTVRLLSLFAPLRQALDAGGLKAVQRDVFNRLREVAQNTTATAPVAIGTGGNLEALAKVLGRTNGLVAQFETQALGELAARAAPMSMAERVSAFHIRPDRADLFLPAVLVLDALASLYGVGRFVVPRTGLRDTLLFDLIVRQVPSPQSYSLGEVRLSLALFDLLYPLHSLWPPARNVVGEVAQRFCAEAMRAPQAVLQASGFADVRPELRAMCLGAMAHLQGKAAPEQPAAIARASAIVAGVIGLGRLLAEGLDLAGVEALAGRMRLDLVGEAPRLYTGKSVPADAARALSRALGRALSIA